MELHTFVTYLNREILLEISISWIVQRFCSKGLYNFSLSFGYYVDSICWTYEFDVLYSLVGIKQTFSFLFSVSIRVKFSFPFKFWILIFKCMFLHSVVFLSLFHLVCCVFVVCILVTKCCSFLFTFFCYEPFIFNRRMLQKMLNKKQGESSRVKEYKGWTRCVCGIFYGICHVHFLSWLETRVVRQDNTLHSCSRNFSMKNWTRHDKK